jgi:hypothetical protein
VVEPPPPGKDSDEAVVTVRDLKTTQPIQPVAKNGAAAEAAPAKQSTGVFCPHCGAEVGVRDLVCTTCERELKPGNSPIKK